VPIRPVGGWRAGLEHLGAHMRNSHSLQSTKRRGKQFFACLCFVVNAALAVDVRAGYVSWRFSLSAAQPQPNGLREAKAFVPSSALERAALARDALAQPDTT